MMPDPAKQPLIRPQLALACAILALALVLRIGGGVRELWLDEVWSLRLASQVDSPLEIFTELKHDNNHWLNTCWLYLLGDGRPWLVYRLLSIAAGIGAVLAAGWVVQRQGRAAQLLAMYLTGGSYLLVNYSSEARGYSLLVLCALLALKAVDEYDHAAKARWLALFWLSSAVGLMAHVGFVLLLAAAGCWGAARWAGRHWSLPRLIALFSLPAMFAVAAYWLQLRGITLGGGTPAQWGRVFTQAASIALGGPASGPAAVLLAAITIVAAVGGLLILARQKTCSWQLVALTIGLPLAISLLASPPFLYVRYFLLACVLALLLLAIVLALLWRQGRVGRAVCLTLLAFWTAGNAAHFAPLAAHGRGEYVALVEWLQDSKPTSNCVTVSSDHDHGIGMLLEYYAGRRGGSASRIAYRQDFAASDSPVDWLILHEDPANPRALDDTITVKGLPFRRERVFETSLLAGWRLHCYRAVDAAAQPADVEPLVLGKPGK